MENQVSIWQSEIENNLRQYFRKWNFTNDREDQFFRVGEYSLIPAGKLFRPLLVRAVAFDHNHHNLNHELAEIAMEYHHVYTLLHDDLPCMDDDHERRGRASAHIKFNEWKALLMGDSLLNISYQALANTQSSNSQDFLKYFSWAMGPKGLIYGQVKDLSLEMTKTFEDLIETHKLKTSRLIQVSLVAGYLLGEDSNFKTARSYHRFGEALGITFQLLDDLCELADEKVSKHENSVNPFFNFKQRTFEELNKRLVFMENFILENKRIHLKMVLKNYFGKIHSILKAGESNLVERVDQPELDKVVATLNRLNL